VFEAIEFAVRAHCGQYRKGTRIPYVMHAIGVGRILIENGCDDWLVAAGILHDTVEDTATSLEDIRRSFGGEVADLIALSSEPDKTATWEDRKRHTLATLESASNDVLLLAMADKLDNIRSIRVALGREGEKVWSRFNRPKADQAWYYRSLADVFKRRAAEDVLFRLLSEFRGQVVGVFGNVVGNPSNGWHDS
jgi:(p)ppGpp synthase/HD superfamily hydrolase